MFEYCIAKKDHLYKILELYKQLHPEENPIDINKANIIWENIENNNIKYFIAIDKENIISTCYLAIIPNLTRNGRSIGFIENVITNDKYRKMGIGKKIIKMAVEYGKQNNCYTIILKSNVKRTEAHKFYEKCGFNGNSKKAFELKFEEYN